MDIVSDRPLNLYFYTHKLVQLTLRCHQRSFFEWWGVVNTETQNEPTAAGKCLWSAQPQMLHQYHVSFSSLGTTEKERWEESRSQRSGRTRLKQCLLDVTGLMNSRLMNFQRLSLPAQDLHTIKSDNVLAWSREGLVSSHPYFCSGLSVSAITLKWWA